MEHAPTGADPHSPAIDPWVIPNAGLQAYKHRDEIRGIWKRLNNRLRGDRSIVAVTGLSGVGKSVLVDHLTGRAASETYAPPGPSRLLEKGLRRAKGLRLLLRTIPGDPSRIRVEAFDELFNAKEPVAGLVHVVANGYSSIRSGYARTQLESRYHDLDAFRAAQQEAEIDDLRLTLDSVRGTMRRHRTPFWVLVAVNKADLFADPSSFSAAEAHYTDPNGAFSRVLSEFADNVGHDNVQWELVPVSAWSETFAWKASVATPQLDRGQQLAMLVRLARAMEQYGGSGS
jgi:hypothetical protein